MTGPPRLIHVLAASVTRAAASPYTFVAAAALVGLWLALGPRVGLPEQRLDLHFVIAVITFFLVLLLEHNSARDTIALHVKLDELLKAQPGARNDAVGSEELAKPDLERLRDRGREEA